VLQQVAAHEGVVLAHLGLIALALVFAALDTAVPGRNLPEGKRLDASPFEIVQ